MNSLQTPAGGHGLLIGENSWLSKCCFHLTLIFLTLIFVGFRPSKIHMALSLKTRNFNFGDPTTPRTPSRPQQKHRCKKVTTHPQPPPPPKKYLTRFTFSLSRYYCTTASRLYVWYSRCSRAQQRTAATGNVDADRRMHARISFAVAC